MRPTSTFVTVLAWVSIILTGLMTLTTLFQNLMAWTIMRSEAARSGGADPSDLEDRPRLFAWIASHVELWFGFWFVVSVVALIASVGLLRRRSWARRLYLLLLILGIAWVLAGIGVLLFFFPNELRFEASPVVGQLWTLSMVVMSGATGALFAWLAWRLTRSEIRAEFERG